MKEDLTALASEQAAERDKVGRLVCSDCSPTSASASPDPARGRQRNPGDGGHPFRQLLHDERAHGFVIGVRLHAGVSQLVDVDVAHHLDTPRRARREREERG